MSLTVHLALVFHVFIAVAVMVMVCGRHGLWLSWYRLVMGKSIQIDSHCRIIMKNFDSVPQLQHFSYVHHCAARSRHGSYSRQCGHSLLQRQLAALLQCGPAGHGFGGLVQQLQDQSPEPRVWTVETVSDRAVNRIELNRIDSFVALNESYRIVFFFAESPITSVDQQ